MSSATEYFTSRLNQSRPLLLNFGASPKIEKSNKSKSAYQTAILYLAPDNLAGHTTVCPGAKVAGCAAGCLNTSGRGKMSSVQIARIRKTKLFFENRSLFLEILKRDIELFVRRVTKKGFKPAIRLNGTSDIAFHHMINFADYPTIQFYDYTKVVKRALDRNLPANYSLTISYSEASHRYAQNVIKTAKQTGKNVAVVFRGTAPKTFKGLPVICGDTTDERFLDPCHTSHIVALTAKGSAKKDDSGFVINSTFRGINVVTSGNVTESTHARMV